jgi:hypothetical protein
LQSSTAKFARASWSSAIIRRPSIWATECPIAHGSFQTKLTTLPASVNSTPIKRRAVHCINWLIALTLLAVATAVSAAEPSATTNTPLARPIDSYNDAAQPLFQQLRHRIEAEPFNLVATIIFFLAVTHTFFAAKIMHYAHQWRHKHKSRLPEDIKLPADAVAPVSFKAEVLHFLGEVEAIFGFWIIPLIGVVVWMKGWPAARDYLNHEVHFTEPMFVVVIMAIAASRPVMRAAELAMASAARLFGGGPAAFWLCILTLGPLLGSFITEPAAMTISALLLAKRFFEFGPSPTFAYATLGLLFVNVSIGGTLTHFAAPPVLMVASKWGWDMQYMLTHFGWKAAIAIVVANAVYFSIFRRQFRTLRADAVDDSAEEKWADRLTPIPVWITLIHLVFLAWTVFTAHYPALFIGGFLFFLAFVTATEHHQNPIVLRPALLVGFFLAGLVVHGGLQAWWIAPILSSLSELPLFFGAVTLTAFNDNAAITYLASLVPDLTPAMKQAVVAGAVVGGGLTVIANAPNPAGQAVLSKYFPDGISPLRLFLSAAIPTAIAAFFFLL